MFGAARRTGCSRTPPSARRMAQNPSLPTTEWRTSVSLESFIEWTMATWNIILGCVKVSPGCAGCYAIKEVNRMAGNPNPKVAAANAGLAYRQDNGVLNWTGVVRVL